MYANKDKEKAAKRAYYLKHKPKFQNYHREYRAKNYEVLKEKRREYWIKNKEILTSKRLANIEKYREISRLRTAQWRLDNPGRGNAATRAWKIKNRDKVILNGLKRIAITKSARLGNQVEIYRWYKQWRSMIFVMCGWCKKEFPPKDCHIDHIIPLSRGGSHSLRNLLVSCKSCNLRKNSKMPQEWLKIISKEKDCVRLK